MGGTCKQGPIHVTGENLHPTGIYNKDLHPTWIYNRDLHPTQIYNRDIHPQRIYNRPHQLRTYTPTSEKQAQMSTTTTTTTSSHSQWAIWLHHHQCDSSFRQCPTINDIVYSIQQCVLLYTTSGTHRKDFRAISVQENCGDYFLSGN